MNEYAGIGSHESKRDEWLFIYTVARLAAAAQAKKEYHEGRHKWWGEKKAAVMAEIRESGINISESIVDELAKVGYASNNLNATRALHGPQVTIKPELVARLQECVTKVEQHMGKVLAYDGWQQALSAAPQESTYSLNINDWLFFFGK